MEVLHINSYYNGSMFYKNLYDKQVENGLDIDVFVPVASSYIEDATKKLGSYTTISVNHGKYDRFLFHLKHSKIYKDIVKRYEVNNFSIIHAHSLFSNGYIAMKLKKKYKVPYIVAVRNTDVNLFFKKFFHLRKLGIKILTESNSVVFLSESYRDEVIGNYVPDSLKKEIYNKSLIIPNGIDDFWFKNHLNKKEVFKKNEINIIYVGAINKNKNILATINAIKLLTRKGYHVNFTVVGSVKDNKIFKKIIKAPFVKYIDPQPKEKLIQIIQENDIFVMPSIKETFGLVYAEAMSQGLPVLYTKGQGFDKQFVEGIVGYHVDCRDPRDIASKIECVIGNYNTISKSCVRNSRVFKWDLLAEYYYDIYKSNETV